MADFLRGLSLPFLFVAMLLLASRNRLVRYWLDRIGWQHYQAVRRRRGLTILACLVFSIGLALATIHICADGGAMAAAYRTCDCRGLEWQLYDRTAADGPRRTLCVGWVRSWTCHQFRSGPVVACPGS